jgi:uncharacterized membrane protein YuzA (DUF378 family)
MNKDMRFGYNIIRRIEKMNMIQKIALVFTIIGAINWGLIGLFNFNLVEAVFGEALLSAIIYMIVGIAGIINIMLLFTDLDR